MGYKISVFEQILPFFAFLANFSILEYKQRIPRIQENLASALAGLLPPLDKRLANLGTTS
ncbi:hypothetical protein [uncultured Fibrobacter sp.]|uniref:hypothetical protein n=1 Tax=uncultured Fibrobacter sp. TaxID=261512 RepID=UPI0025F1C33C|nr:hypothetical protein [uncultured Fibrobacter sp.]